MKRPWAIIYFPTIDLINKQKFPFFSQMNCLNSKNLNTKQDLGVKTELLQISDR